MIIALFACENQEKYALQIIEFFAYYGVETIADEKLQLAGRSIQELAAEDIDYVISLGGDGTILRFFHQFPLLRTIPILGVNLGHLGFMADVPLSELFACLNEFLLGAYTIHERISLDAKTPTSSWNVINDIVVHRAHNPSLIELAIYANDVYLNTFEADGVIIATPNGSTAYSLAAGGPILTPELTAMVLTPISPHTISNRPVVLGSEQQIRIELISQHHWVEMRGDGLYCEPLQSGQSLLITQGTHSFRLINLLRRDYFSTVRTKLGWSGKLR